MLLFRMLHTKYLNQSINMSQFEWDISKNPPYKRKLSQTDFRVIDDGERFLVTYTVSRRLKGDKTLLAFLRNEKLSHKKLKKLLKKIQ